MESAPRQSLDLKDWKPGRPGVECLSHPIPPDPSPPAPQPCIWNMHPLLGAGPENLWLSPHDSFLSDDDVSLQPH